ELRVPKTDKSQLSVNPVNSTCAGLGTSQAGRSWKHHYVLPKFKVKLGAAGTTPGATARSKTWPPLKWP
ncbi:hypothetical protein A2U01_0095552, partial [Trifolium medium]|nr:hypothetical protein [Trifolium medium]